ncbi:hypothetical protein F5888DRAFT_1909626 [Russula emetica]|nr:hypothetical protein F5888DRAFT_1909626 [Russula emetica]
MVEAREVQSKTIAENHVEQQRATVNERIDHREAALREQMENERSRTEAAEARVEELERVLKKVNSAVNSRFLHLGPLYHQLMREDQKPLSIVRKMGAEMEAEEREYCAKAFGIEQGEAVREVHEAITALQELDTPRHALCHDFQ